MNKKVYVGNLPFEIEEAALKEMFEADGKHVASVQIITDRYTGRPRGFGFVEFESEADAQGAIESFNGKELKGRALVVSEAREQSRSGGRGESRGGGGGFGGGGGGGGRGGRSFGGGGGGRGDRGHRSPRW